MAPLSTPRQQLCAYAADVAVERDDARGAQPPLVIYALPSSPPPPSRPPCVPETRSVFFPAGRSPVTRAAASPMRTPAVSRLDRVAPRCSDDNGSGTHGEGGADRRKQDGMPGTESTEINFALALVYPRNLRRPIRAPRLLADRHSRSRFFKNKNNPCNPATV